MAVWDDILTERDKQVFSEGGFGARIGFGEKLALVIIDVNYNFVGDKPEPVQESVKRFPLSCGQEGWEAVHQIASLLPLAREKRVPVIYSTSDRSPAPEGQRTMIPSRRQEIRAHPERNNIVKEIAPAENDIVIYKRRPSVFFGTPLVSMLIVLQTDTLLICGTTTSGCVRASVVDAFSYGYRVAVIEECTFDRGQASHKINLFDMNAKYADVLSVTEVKDYLARL